jgi:acylphosphatase
LKVRAEILVNGLVQGVGYRYFAYRTAQQLGVNGYVKNLYTGEVLTVVEGERAIVEELINKLRVGPSHAYVKNCAVDWQKPKDEFDSFEVH